MQHANKKKPTTRNKRANQRQGNVVLSATKNRIELNVLSASAPTTATTTSIDWRPNWNCENAITVHIVRTDKSNGYTRCALCQACTAFSSLWPVAFAWNCNSVRWRWPTVWTVAFFSCAISICLHVNRTSRSSACHTSSIHNISKVELRKWRKKNTHTTHRKMKHKIKKKKQRHTSKPTIHDGLYYVNWWARTVFYGYCLLQLVSLLKSRTSTFLQITHEKSVNFHIAFRIVTIKMQPKRKSETRNRERCICDKTCESIVCSSVNDGAKKTYQHASKMVQYCRKLSNLISGRGYNTPWNIVLNEHAKEWK